jgi:hypothetical protein
MVGEVDGRTPVSTQLGFVQIPGWDVSDDLARIKCPTLVITTEESGSHRSRTRGRGRKRFRTDPARLPGDSFHVAVTDSARCASETLDFIRRRQE